MREFPGRYPRPKKLVDPALVGQALANKDYDMALSGIITAIWQLYEGEANIPLPEIYRWVQNLPHPWSQHSEIRLITCWAIINEGDYTQAVLIIADVAEWWATQLDGPDADLARQWLHYLRSAQGIIYDQLGQYGLAREAFAAAHGFLPRAPVPPIRAVAALEMEAEEAERLIAADPAGFSSLLIDALGIHQQNGDRRALAHIAHNLGECYLLQGRLSGARYWLEKAWELKRIDHGRLPLLFTLVSLGSCYRQLGLLDEAHRVLDELLASSQLVGSLFHQVYGFSELANIHRDRDEVELALEMYQRALELWDTLHDHFGRARSLLDLSSLHRRQGQYALASECLALVHRQSYGQIDPFFRLRVRLFTQINVLLQEASEPPVAELMRIVRELHELHAIREEILGRWYLALGYRLLGEGERAIGEAAQALELAMGHGHLRLLSLELIAADDLFTQLVHSGTLPEAVVGIVRLVSPQRLERLLERSPVVRTLAAATGRLGEVRGVTVKLLGGFHLYRAGSEVSLSSIRSQKAITLLKLLIAKRRQVVAREQIFDAIWPDVETEAADRSFDVTLSTLRKLLDTPGEPPLIIRRGRGYTINPEILLTIDAEQFVEHWEKGHWWLSHGQTTAAIAEWRNAEALYVGDFLADDLYEDWPTAERENLREKYLELLVRIGDASLSERRYDRAIDRARRVLTVDPLRETAYRLLMKAHAALGDRAVALRDYRRCEQVLRQELGEEPMAETRELAQRIRHGQGL